MVIPEWSCWWLWVEVVLFSLVIPTTIFSSTIMSLWLNSSLLLMVMLLVTLELGNPILLALNGVVVVAWRRWCVVSIGASMGGMKNCLLPLEENAVKFIVPLTGTRRWEWRVLGGTLSGVRNSCFTRFMGLKAWRGGERKGDILGVEKG